MHLKRFFFLILLFLLNGCFSDFDYNFLDMSDDDTTLPVPTHSIYINLSNNSSYWFEALLTISSLNVINDSINRNTDYENSILKPDESSEIGLIHYDSDYTDEELNNCIRFFNLILEFADGSKVYIEGLPEDLSDKNDAIYYGLGYHQGVNSGLVISLDSDNQYSAITYTITVNDKDDIEIHLNDDNSNVYSPED